MKFSEGIESDVEKFYATTGDNNGSVETYTFRVSDDGGT